MSQNESPVADTVDISVPEAIDLASVPNVLIRGPVMTKKFELLVALLTRADDHAVVITTKHNPDNVRAVYREMAGNGDGVLGIVDALEANGQGDHSDEGELTRGVSSAGNLTRIGIEFSTLLDSLSNESEHVAVGLHSLSPMVMAVGLQPVYRFLGAMTARIRRDDRRGIVVLDTPVGDHQIESLGHHFDAVLETRSTTDNRRQLRVTRAENGSSDWLTY